MTTPIASIHSLVAEEGTCPLCSKKRKEIVHVTMHTGKQSETDVCINCLSILLRLNANDGKASKPSKVADG